MHLRKEKSKTAAEQIHLHDHDRAEQKFRVKRRSCKDHYNDQRSHRQHHVHHAARHLRYREDVFWHIDFFQKRCVYRHRFERVRRARLHKIIQNPAGEKINRKIFDRFLK